MAQTPDTHITPGMQAYIDRNNEYLRRRSQYIREVVKKWKFDTIAVHGLYSVEDAIEDYQGAIIEPVFASSGQAYYDRKLQGALDEVSLYSRALSAAEIATLYSAGSAGKCMTTPVRLRDAVLRDGQLSFILEGELGRSYAIEVSTDLKHWSYWKDCTQSENALQINAPAVQTRQFYRAKPLP